MGLKRLGMIYNSHYFYELNVNLSIERCIGVDGINRSNHS